jgi:hypothetical protein
MDKQIRVAMKRKVKSYLQQLLGDKFQSCVINALRNNEQHHTYGIESKNQKEFLAWAKTAMKAMGVDC